MRILKVGLLKGNTRSKEDNFKMEEIRACQYAAGNDTVEMGNAW